MSGKACGKPWKYTVTHSKKALKVSNQSETGQHLSQVTKIVLTA